MAFNQKLNKLLEKTQKKKPFDYDIIFTKKKLIQEIEYFTSSKTQGTFNGRKRCRLMVGCGSKHCLEGYWEGLQEV